MTYFSFDWFGEKSVTEVHTVCKSTEVIVKYYTTCFYPISKIKQTTARRNSKSNSLWFTFILCVFNKDKNHTPWFLACFDDVKISPCANLFVLKRKCSLNITRREHFLLPFFSGIATALKLYQHSLHFIKLYKRVRTLVIRALFIWHTWTRRMALNCSRAMKDRTGEPWPSVGEATFWWINEEPW